MKKGTLLLLMILSCSSVLVGQEKPKPYDDLDAYEAYAAIIGKGWSGAGFNKLVIQAETTFPNRSMCLKPAPDHESKLGPLIASYSKANKRPLLLQRMFGAKFTYEIISKPYGPPGSHARYPDGGAIISLSAVGFNADKTLALFYMASWCGPLCGSGKHHLLEKNNGKWNEIPWLGESCSWVS